MSDAGKRGYLNENYKLFHINDKRAMDFDSHSHDFHKLILCLGGSVTYTVEGKTYELFPWDMLIVPKNRIHHSKTDALCAYERVVFFIDESYLSSFDDGVLSKCFEEAYFKNKCMAHIDGETRNTVARLVSELEKPEHGEYGAKFLSDNIFLQLMVHVNRIMLGDHSVSGHIADKKINKVIEYINAHSSEDISAESLSRKFYISRSYLMHRFKEVTGGSIHGYVIQKRLSGALAMMRDGVPILDAARENGFADYTVFYRNFKKTYGISPTDMLGEK